MAISPLAALAAITGLQSVGSMVGSFIGNKMSRSNMKYANDLNVENQLNAPQRTVSGLKMAGLNPALAEGGAFSSPSVSAPSATSPMQSLSVPDLVSMENQSRLADAQIELLESQSQAIQMENNRTLSQDLTIDANLHALADSELVKKSPIFGFLVGNLTEVNDSLNKGSLDGLVGFMDFLNQGDNVATSSLENEFIRQFNKAKLAGKVPETLAKLPEAQLKGLMADLALTYTTIAKLHAETDLTEETTKKIVVDTAKEYHSDYAQMWKNGDYSAFFMSLGSEALKSFSGGAGLGAGMYVTKGQGVKRAPSKSVSSSIGTPFKKPSPFPRKWNE